MNVHVPPNHALAALLSKEIEGEVLFDRASRGRYATDASIYQIEPLGVVIPKTEADVETAAEIAREAGVPAYVTLPRQTPFCKAAYLGASYNPFSPDSNPNDDGYLTSPNGVTHVNNQVNPTSFTDLYSIKVNNPDNYSLPRRIKVGVSFNF